MIAAFVWRSNRRYWKKKVKMTFDEACILIVTLIISLPILLAWPIISGISRIKRRG